MALPAKTRDPKSCPKCGADVLFVGFTTSAVQTETWMRIDGRLQRIATTINSSDKATCNCGAVLPGNAADLFRAA